MAKQNKTEKQNRKTETKEKRKATGPLTRTHLAAHLPGPAHLPPPRRLPPASRSRCVSTHAQLRPPPASRWRPVLLPDPAFGDAQSPPCPLSLPHPQPLPSPGSLSHRPSATIAAPRCPRGHSPPLASLAVQPLRQDVAGLSIEASELGTRCSVAIVFVFNVGHRREPPSICRLPVVPELFEPQFYSL